MESGRWEGEFLDSSGQSATVRLFVEEGGDTRSGRFELIFKTEDEPFVVSNACEIRIDGGRVHFEVPAAAGEAAGEAGGERTTVTYSASLADAGTHARQAIYGSIDEIPVEGLHGGVFIAFRYEERAAGRTGYEVPPDDVPPRRTVDDLLRDIRRRIGRIRLPVLRGGR